MRYLVKIGEEHRNVSVNRYGEITVEGYAGQLGNVAKIDKEWIAEGMGKRVATSTKESAVKELIHRIQYR